MAQQFGLDAALAAEAAAAGGASEQLQAMLPGRLIAGEQGIREWREETRREVPLWPWLLAAAALIFMMEGWASTVAAKRREAAAGGAAPVTNRARMPGRRADT